MHKGFLINKQGGQIAGKNLVAAGAAGKKLVVLPAILHQRMGDTQHQRDVGAHMRRDPLHRIAKEIDSFRSHRIDADQAFSALAQPVEPSLWLPPLHRF